MIYAFGDCDLDTCRGVLHHDGKPVKLGCRVVDTLTYLVHHRHRVVSRDELNQQVWPQQLVSYWALPRCISEARKAIRAGSATGPGWKRAAPGKGAIVPSAWAWWP